MVKSLGGDIGQDENESTKTHSQPTEYGQIE